MIELALHRAHIEELLRDEEIERGDSRVRGVRVTLARRLCRLSMEDTSGTINSGSTRDRNLGRTSGMENNLCLLCRGRRLLRDDDVGLTLWNDSSSTRTSGTRKTRGTFAGSSFGDGFVAASRFCVTVRQRERMRGMRKPARPKTTSTL